MRITPVIAVGASIALCACLDEPGNSSSTSTLSIVDIQGDSLASPLQGESVTVSGVVTGDFQDNDADSANNLGGFFIQDAGRSEHGPASSGIFVFDGRNPEIDVAVGDRVLVRGKVQEHFDETQLAASHVRISGTATLQPVDLIFPATAVIENSDVDYIADLEAYEGMLVRIPNRMTVTDVYELERFGAIGISAGGRLFQFTHLNPPDVNAYLAHKRGNAARFLMLDDGQRESNIQPIRYLNPGGSSRGALRVGDSVSGLVGNLRYSRGSGGQGAASWRLMPVRAPDFSSTNPRPGKPELAGRLRVASFNVLNYFSTIDAGEPICGPEPGNCRGADSVREQTRQLAKIVTALRMIDADIVGLIELENNDSESLQDIVVALNERYGERAYSALVTGTIGDDAIRTGFLFKPASVGLAGGFAVLDSTVDKRFDDSRNRPALAQSFLEKRSNGVLTVVLNHLKSKGSDCDSEGDVNAGDGQGNCNGVRTKAALALADWIATDPTKSRDPDVLIIGDLNAYAAEDPLTALAEAGFSNLLDASEDAASYSFVFASQTGALDHALASASLAAQVVETMEWHINADESSVHDYNLEHGRDPVLFNADIPYRASDHDPIIVSINLAEK